MPSKHWLVSPGDTFYFHAFTIFQLGMLEHWVFWLSSPTLRISESNSYHFRWYPSHTCPPFLVSHDLVPERSQSLSRLASLILTPPLREWVCLDFPALTNYDSYIVSQGLSFLICRVEPCTVPTTRDKALLSIDSMGQKLQWSSHPWCLPTHLLFSAGGEVGYLIHGFGRNRCMCSAFCFSFFFFPLGICLWVEGTQPSQLFHPVHETGVRALQRRPVVVWGLPRVVTG